MDVERPLRQEIVALVRWTVEDAEAASLLSRHYKWHRRFALGIDCTIEAARKRTLITEPESHPRLRKVAELAMTWLTAQTQKAGSYERATMMHEALALYEELTD